MYVLDSSALFSIHEKETLGNNLMYILRLCYPLEKAMEEITYM